MCTKNATWLNPANVNTGVDVRAGGGATRTRLKNSDSAKQFPNHDANYTCHVLWARPLSQLALTLSRTSFLMSPGLVG